jgi:hypothetical protein
MALSQDLSKHQWKNRVLLVISQESKTDELPKTYVKQINAIKDSLDGYIDRKLLLYEVFPERYEFTHLKEKEISGWIDSNRLFELYNKDNEAFKVVLIGLDGNVKEVRTKFFPSQELFDLIESMPMRQSEMRRQ